MLLFLIGLAIAVMGAILVLNTLNSIFLIVFLIGLLISTISAFQPLSGWGEPKTMEEYELLPLIPGTDTFVIQDRRGNVMYKYLEKEVKLELIKSQNYYCSIIEEIESGKKPVLKKSKVNPKRSLWAFPILSLKYVDVLCVPKTGVVK